MVDDEEEPEVDYTDWRVHVREIKFSPAQPELLPSLIKAARNDVRGEIEHGYPDRKIEPGEVLKLYYEVYSSPRAE